jgi:NAD(P)-dependent dehydrogenase (short-subunit alcohol dehydrogenase family)
MKSVLIIGANRGIGLETAKQLSGKGLFVYLGCRYIDNGNILVEN